ncbi:MAG: hypothetical protein P1V35_12260 [Planctomycetota bacterium]|nr:hypothetical protein [Planctomycetota bacterium]
MSTGKTLRAMAIALITWSIGSLFWVVSQRLLYPFALEWMEGGMLQHANQIRRGLDLYGAPSPDFTPFPYPPLFPWMMSLLPGDAWSFAGPRILALVGYVGVAGCLWWLARRQGVARIWLAMGLAVWAGGFAFGGGWYDVARSDGWALFLHLAGACCLWGEGGRKRAIAAGVLFLLAGLAKQIGWPMGLLCAVAYTWQRKPGVAELWGTLLFGAVACFLWIPTMFGDWAYFYIFEVLAGHPMGWSLDHMLPLLVSVAPGALLAFWVLTKMARKSHPGHGDAPMLVALLVGWTAVFVMGAVHAGAYDNVNLPALLIAAVGVIFAGGYLSLGGYAWPRMGSWVMGACVLQLGLLAYDPRTWVPTSEYTAACEVLEIDVASRSGPVLAPGHGYLLERQGIESGIHWMALFDLSASGDGAWGRQVVEGMEQRIREGRYPRAISDRLNGVQGVEMDMGPWLRGFYEAFEPPHRMLGIWITERWEGARKGRSRWDPPSGAPWSPLYLHSGPRVSPE